MNLLAAFRAELTKQFTTAIWWILALVLVLYVGSTVAGLSFVFAAASTGALGDVGGPPVPTEGLPATLYSLAASVGYVFPLLIGTLMVTSEFRHKTLTPTFLATPRRGTVLWAKMTAGVVMGALYAALGLAAAVGPAAGILLAFGEPADLDSPGTWALLGRIALAYALWVLVGIGVGTVVRNQVATIVIVLAFTQFVEPIARLAGGFVDGLDVATGYLPGAASDTLVGYSLLSMGGAPGADGPEWWGGALVLLGYAVVFLLIGQATSWRRDVD